MIPNIVVVVSPVVVQAAPPPPPPPRPLPQQPLPVRHQRMTTVMTTMRRRTRRKKRRRARRTRRTKGRKRPRRRARRKPRRTLMVIPSLPPSPLFLLPPLLQKTEYLPLTCRLEQRRRVQGVHGREGEHVPGALWTSMFVPGVRGAGQEAQGTLPHLSSPHQASRRHLRLLVVIHLLVILLLTIPQLLHLIKQVVVTFASCHLLDYNPPRKFTSTSSSATPSLFIPISPVSLLVHRPSPTSARTLSLLPILL